MERLLLLASDAVTAFFFFLGSAEFQYIAVGAGALAYAYLTWKDGTLQQERRQRKLNELRLNRK